MISSIAQEISPSSHYTRSRGDSILPPAPRSRGSEEGASGSGRQTARVRRQDDTCNPSLPTFPPTATGRARAGPTASTRGRCGRLGIANVVSPRRSRRGWARRRVRGARRTKKELKPPAPISTSPGSASTDTLKAELRGQATRRMCAHSGEDDDVHVGRGDIRDNGRAQQPTLRERRLPHRARYTAPLSVQVRPAALSACRANG
ncbi:hypothetical protein K438DRAFT_1895098 [Mycena galopus ATCC 62051]|nr:hypothetical protein K438DRAFT_1895098 [Mycena galopus ATCC 62051]